METVFSCGGAELREASGETYTTLVKDGTLTVKRGPAGVAIDVAGEAIEWVASAPGGACKRIDTRSFSFATNDLMSFYYVTLPRGLPEAKYERCADVLAALKEGRPIPDEAPAPAPAPAAAPAAAAAAPAATATPAATGTPADDAAAAAKPGQPGNQGFGAMLKNIADKAAHDTMMLGDAIRQKAEHDMKQFGGGAPKPA